MKWPPFRKDRRSNDSVFLGKTFGCWTVLERGPRRRGKRGGRGGYTWRCVCQCGTIAYVPQSTLKGRIRSKSENTPGCIYCRRNSSAHIQVRTIEYTLFAGARTRAKFTNTGKRRKKPWPFSIIIDDIVIPKVCPLLGIPIQHKGRGHDNNASLDRIDSNKGYTPSNVWVISHRANTLKSSGTWQEHMLLAKNLKKKVESIGVRVGTFKRGKTLPKKNPVK